MHHFFLLIVGAVIGGLLFVLLDQLINQKGGYLRKTAYIISKAAVDKERFFKKRSEGFTIDVKIGSLEGP